MLVSSSAVSGDLARTTSATASVHVKQDDFPAAVEVVRRREAVIGALSPVRPPGTSTATTTSTVPRSCWRRGDLPGAADLARRLARLPFNREEEHLGLAPQLKIAALAGHFDAVVDQGERFLASWQRVGCRRIANLANHAHAVAMVHGILGDDDRRERWVQITHDLAAGYPMIAAFAWEPTFARWWTSIAWTPTPRWPASRPMSTTPTPGGADSS